MSDGPPFQVDLTPVSK